MSAHSPNYSNSKFTKGEKCLFAHVVITFCVIVAIIVSYFGHACLVRHRGNLGIELNLRNSPEHPIGPALDGERIPYSCVGAVYVGTGKFAVKRLACGAVLVAPRWSLVTARCVTARAQPVLSHLLPYWTLRYETNSTGVRRGVTHPQYDDDDAACDLGLFEHEIALLKDSSVKPCTVPTQITKDEIISDLKDLYIVGWKIQGGRSVTLVRGLPSAKCTQYTSPVTEQAADTVCVAASSDANDDTLSLLGGVLFKSSQMIGISSWGKGDNSFPLIVVDVAAYKNWLELTMSEGFIFK